jgi:hypothetical protein
MTLSTLTFQLATFQLKAPQQRTRFKDWELLKPIVLKLKMSLMDSPSMAGFKEKKGLRTNFMTPLAFLLNRSIIILVPKTVASPLFLQAKY